MLTEQPTDLTPLNSFFGFDRDVGWDVDSEIIWKDFIKRYPELLDETLKPILIKKLILSILDDTIFINNIIEYYACTIKDIIKIFIANKFLYFDKYLTSRLSNILVKYN